jgi:hypothetical protein
MDRTPGFSPAATAMSAPAPAAAASVAQVASAAQESAAVGTEMMVSLRAEVPEALLASMRGFIEQHPNWDQYRLFQAALAGFLVQNGVQSRDVTRCYLANLFPGQPRFRSA